MSFFIPTLYDFTLEATIFDSKHRAVTILGGMRLPQDIVMEYFRDTFNEEFGKGYTCEVEKVMPNGLRLPVCDWAI